jgi:hypothetical protein
MHDGRDPDQFNPERVEAFRARQGLDWHRCSTCRQWFVGPCPAHEAERFRCEVCGRDDFKSVSSRTRHVNVNHPTAPPKLGWWSRLLAQFRGSR